MTFLSFGFCYYNGSKMYAIYPLNLLILPFLKLFGLDAPIVTIMSYDE